MLKNIVKLTKALILRLCTFRHGSNQSDIIYDNPQRKWGVWLNLKLSKKQRKANRHKTELSA